MKGILTQLRERFASTTVQIESVMSPKSGGNDVLVVDDDNAVCRIVERMLSDEQYHVQTGQSVADALRVIEQKPFDAYVMDYKSPDGSGLGMLQKGFSLKEMKSQSFLSLAMTQLPSIESRKAQYL